MKDKISNEFFNAAQKLYSNNINIATELNKVLNNFLPWPFKAAAGYGIDSEGKKTITFNTIIYSTNSKDSSPESIEISSDNLACAIDGDHSKPGGHATTSCTVASFSDPI